MSKRKKPMKKKSSNPMKAHKARAWKVFSEMIRKRDCLATTGTLTHCVCVTCGKTVEYGASLHCGHFVPSRANSILYRQDNVAGQCMACNFYGQGKQIEFTLWMQKHHGQDVIDELLALKHKAVTFTTDELDEMMAGWRTQIAELESSHSKNCDVNSEK